MSHGELEYKLQIWIDEELHLRLRRVFPHGLRRELYTRLTEDILDLMESSKNPELVAGAIISGHIRLAITGHAGEHKQKHLSDDNRGTPRADSRGQTQPEDSSEERKSSIEEQRRDKF